MPRMTPSEALVETLVAEGIRDVFGIVGSAFMDALDLFPAAGIRFIPVAHEQAAAHAADGYARVTGRPQACIAQNGPGAANFVSAITAAFWAHSPVVAITLRNRQHGYRHRRLPGTRPDALVREIDQIPGTCQPPERMAELARRCFYMAKLLNGPTQLNIPRDFFYGDLDCEIYKSGDVCYGPGPEEQVKQAAEMLSKAKFPVILAGGGVSQSNAHDEAKALAEYLTRAVVNTYLHNDSFPADHQLAVGPIGYCGSKAAMRLIAKADVVLAIGTRLGPFGTLPQYDIDYWPKNAKIIQVDVDASQLGLSRRSISV